jgi:hypothetical protein
VGGHTVMGQAGCVCTQVKSIGQPDAGNPHVRLDEGAPVVDVMDDRALLDTHETLEARTWPHWKPVLEGVPRPRGQRVRRGRPPRALRKL